MRSPPLLSVVLLLALVPSALSAQGLAPGFVAVHRSEPVLLHKQLDPSLLRKLLIWDARHTEWRQMQGAEAPAERTPLLILHLWADYCAPCREEFPILRELEQEITRKHGGDARFVYLSETSSPEEMNTFLERNKARMPPGPHYLDTNEAIANKLREGLAGTLSYPVTVVLDSQRIVRHAFVGRVTARRAELLTAVERLLAIKSPARNL